MADSKSSARLTTQREAPPLWNPQVSFAKSGDDEEQMVGQGLCRRVEVVLECVSSIVCRTLDALEDAGGADLLGQFRHCTEHLIQLFFKVSNRLARIGSLYQI